LEAVGGLSYLATLDLDLPDLGRLDEYVTIVKEKSVRRDLIVEAQRTLLATLSTARPVHELLADLRASADKLFSRAARTHWEGAGEVLDRLLAILEDDRSKALCGLTTGFPAWDQLGPASCRAGSTSSLEGPAWAKPRWRSTSPATSPSS